MKLCLIIFSLFFCSCETLVELTQGTREEREAYAQRQEELKQERAEKARLQALYQQEQIKKREVFCEQNPQICFEERKALQQGFIDIGNSFNSKKKEPRYDFQCYNDCKNITNYSNDFCKSKCSY